MCCSDNPNNSLINKFTCDIGKALDSYTSNYGDFLIAGDFNPEITESSIN